MDYKKLRQLLDHYYDGKTTIEEEELIKKTLSSEDLPVEFQNDQYLLNSFKEIKEETQPNQKLEEELVDLIEHQWTKYTKSRFKRTVIGAVGIAASLLIGFFIYNNKEVKSIQTVDTYANEEEAYQATKQVLSFISGTMNKELSPLSTLNQFNTKLKTLDQLSKINKTVNNYKSKAK